MIIAELPGDEELRLLDIHSYQLQDSTLDLEFDELVDLAANTCQCPVSVISLLYKDNQWFKARTGTSITNTPREHAICGHTILQDNVFVIEDTKSDERFHDNPLVCGEMDIRFYAGVPILSPTGYKLGSICVMDRKPRKLTSIENKSLTLIASYITRLLELRTKNKEIHQRSAELLSLNKLVIQNEIEGNESFKQTIATELHENLAQMLAASRIFLQMAIQNEAGRINYIQQVIDDLGTLLNRMRIVSNTILPGGVETFSLEEIISNLIRREEKSYPFEVTVNCKNKNHSLNPEKNLTCIRIIEGWLSVLKKSSNVKKVNVLIGVSENIPLQIEDDGSSKEFKDAEQELCSAGIYGRVQQLKGSLSYSIGRNKNMLCIRFDQFNAVA